MRHCCKKNKLFVLILILAFYSVGILFSQVEVFSQDSFFVEIKALYDAKFYPGVVVRAGEFEKNYSYSLMLPEVQLYAGESLYRLNQKTTAKEYLSRSLAFFERRQDSTTVKEKNLYGKVLYWLGRITFDEKKFLNAANQFSKAASLLKENQLNASDDKLYIDSLFFGAKACVESENEKAAIPVLEFLWDKSMGIEQERVAKLLLFHSYRKEGLQEKLINAYENLKKYPLQKNDWHKIQLYAADAYAATEDFTKAYELYCQLIEKAEEKVALNALQSAWSIATEVPDGNRNNLLEKASMRLTENPLMLAEFRTRLGIENFQKKNYASALENFKISEEILNSTKVEQQENIFNLKMLNTQYITEMEFIFNGANSKAASYSYSTLLSTVPKQSLTNPSVQRQLARYSAVSNMWQATLTHANNGLPNAEAAYWKALALFKLGDFTKCCSTLQQYVFSDNNEPLPKKYIADAAVLYADALFANQDEKTLDVYQRIEQSGLFTDSMYLDYAATALKMGQPNIAYRVASKSKTDIALYLAGLSAFEQQDWTTAETMFYSYIYSSDQTYNSYASYFLGISQYKQNQFANAYDSLTSFAKNNPLHMYCRNSEKTALLCAMQLYQQQNNSLWLEAAYNIAQRLVETAPSVAEREAAIIQAVAICSDSARYEEGLKMLRPYLSRTDDFGIACRYQSAELLIKQQSFEQADKLFEEVQRLAKNNSTSQIAAYRRAEMYYSEKKYDLAAERFNLYRKEYPNGIYIDSALYFNGDCFKQIKQEDQAILCYDTLVSLRPESSFVFGSLLELVSLYREKNEYQQAYQAAEKLFAKYKDQALIAGIDSQMQELELLMETSNQQITEARIAYEKVGGITTPQGREKALYLAKLWLYSEDDSFKGKDLLHQIIEVGANATPAENNTLASAAQILGQWYRETGNSSKAATLFLDSAFYYAAFDLEQASAIMYRAAESFDSAGLYADAVSVVAKMEELFPDSQWTIAASEFK